MLPSTSGQISTKTDDSALQKEDLEPDVTVVAMVDVENGAAGYLERKFLSLFLNFIYRWKLEDIG